MLRSSIRILSTALALLTVGTALAHDFTVGHLFIEHPWARVTAAQQSNGAAYFTVTNDGAADRLLEAQSPIADRVELHAHDVDSEGVMRMRRIEAIDLAAGETTALAPGGVHVMLIGLTGPLVEGERFPLTLVFEQAGTVDVVVAVEPVTYGIGESDGGHSH